jgi:Tfp pilus assembly protein PilN
MKAVNLIPGDSPSAGSVRVPKLAVPTYALLGALAFALVITVFYVSASNSVADRQAQVTSLKTEVAQAQQEASRLAAYGQFTTLEQQRVQSVRGIAETRFDWNSALGELAAVIPANTSLQTLSGSVVPGASAGGTGGSGGLRAAQTGPAVEVQGCTSNQDDVARLISRLRTMDDVTRVALSSSAKASVSGGAAPSQPSGSGATTGCASSAPTFDLIVFYKPIAGAGAQGATSLGSTSATTTTTGGAK